MSRAVIVVVVLVGTVGALLMSRAHPIARALWPGPTVKGPGDVYAQAFQALFCIAVLGLIALASSIVSLAISRRVAWNAGLWLSGLPVLFAAVMLVKLWLTRGR